MLNKNHEEEIEEFKKYMLEKHGLIRDLTVDSRKDEILFKNILFVTYLDSLAACVYPEIPNKERFIRLINRFSHWENRDRVSLGHLAKFVTITPNPEIEKLRKYIFSETGNWNNESYISIDKDPKIDELKGYEWNPNKATGGKICLEDFKHSHLLYQTRNSLVHQFQVRGFEFGSTYRPEEPYYERVDKINAELKFVPDKMVLIYPVSFLQKLTETILENVVEYFSESNLNPFPSYYSGEYLLSELNGK